MEQGYPNRRMEEGYAVFTDAFQGFRRAGPWNWLNYKCEPRNSINYWLSRKGVLCYLAVYFNRMNENNERTRRHLQF
jgi:hypothetical protein